MPVKKKNTRKKIIQSANEIIYASGVNAFTLEEVAKNAGISKGGLLHHFPSKETLIKSMIENFIEEFARGIMNKLEKIKNPAEYDWLKVYIDHVMEDELTTKQSSFLLASVANNPELLVIVQENVKKWKLIMQDTADPVLAMIVSLAIDGYWLSRILGLNLIDENEKKAVKSRLKLMLDKEPLE